MEGADHDDFLKPMLMPDLGSTQTLFKVNAPKAAPPYRFPLKVFREVKLPRKGSHLIKDIIPRTGLIVCYGPPKQGKTFVVMDLALHVALGWPYRGHRTKHGPVIYICCEGERGFLTRLDAFRRRYLVGKTDEPQFHVLTTNLTLPGQCTDLISDIRIQNVRPALIVIDTLNRTMAGSESSDESMSEYIRSLDSIRDQFNCAVLVVHHCGHNTHERPRGHSSLMGASDTQIAVWWNDKRGPITAEVQLMKDGLEGAKTYSTLEVLTLGDDEDGEPITSCVVVPADALALMRSNSDRSPKMYSSVQTALRALREAIDESGEEPPKGAGIPEEVSRVILTDKWREKASTLGISKGNREAHRVAFGRALKELQAAKLAAVVHPYAWLTPPTTADTDK